MIKYARTHTHTGSSNLQRNGHLLRIDNHILKGLWHEYRRQEAIEKKDEKIDFPTMDNLIVFVLVFSCTVNDGPTVRSGNYI